MSEADQLPEPAGKREPLGSPDPAAVGPSPGLDQSSASSERTIVQGMAQEVFEDLRIAMHSEPRRNPMLDKVTAEHITRILDSENRESELAQERYKLRLDYQKERLRVRSQERGKEKQGRRSFLIYVCLAVIVGIFALCWLFLYFQQAQYIVTVISSVIAFVGGLGMGRSSVSKGQEASIQPENVEKATERA